MTFRREIAWSKRWLGILIMSFGVLMIALSFSGNQSARADDPLAHVFIEPAAVQVAADTAFTIQVKHTVNVNTVAVQFKLNFDPTLVQIATNGNCNIGAADPAFCPTRGSAWLNAGGSFVFGPGANKNNGIAEANTTGVLEGISVFIQAGNLPANLPPGTNVAMTVPMRSRPGVQGFSAITVSNLSVIEIWPGSGLPVSIPVTTAAGFVTVGNPPPTATTTVAASATPEHTNTPGPSPTPSNSPTITNTPQATNTPTVTSTGTVTPTPTITKTPTATSSAQPTATATATAPRSATMKLVPATITVPPSYEFPVHLSHNANFTVIGAETDFEFDQQLLQVISIEKSPAYSGAQMVAGVSVASGEGFKKQTTAEAIAEANSSGKLKNVAVVYTPGDGSAAAGENAFITIKLKSTATNGTSDVKLTNTDMIDEDGEALGVVPAAGEVVVQTGAVAPTPVPPPVAEGSGPTTQTAGGRTNSVAGATAGSGTSARGLPNAGDGEDNTKRIVLLLLGIVATSVGAVVATGGAFKRRM